MAVIIDIFSRKCVGWELGKNLDAQLTLSALKKALKDRNTIHHSDQGVQYPRNMLAALKNVESRSA